MTGDDLAPRPAADLEEELEERRTSYLELFFDLVVVFAITQVTSLVLSDTSAAGFARSLLVLALVWFAWSGFAWMTNAIDVESIFVRVSVLVGMAATFMMAFAVPGAYGEDGAWFGASYLGLVVVNIALYINGARPYPELLRAVLRLAPFFLVSPVLLLVGGLLEGNVRVVVWIAAIAFNVAGALDAGRSTWRVSPSHFAERHALFVIIALGESIVAIGVGALESHRDLTLAAAILAALAGTFTLWWAYFDFIAPAVERALRRVQGAGERGRLARDLFTFVHFPIIAGIVLFAVAAKKAVAHGDEPLSGAGRFALGAGLAIFLVGFALGRYRVVRTIAWERLGAAAGAILLSWLAADLAAAALIALATLVVAIALAAETVRLKELRTRIRTG
jgi:low temperature requirement protein LtrA